jgi:hypothetical protein
VLAVTPYAAGEHDTWFNIQMAVPLYTLRLMGANPLWAPPNATHLLHSTSVVTRVKISATALWYTTYDTHAVERLRLAPGFVRRANWGHANAASPPPGHSLSVSAGGVALPRVESALKVRRRRSGGQVGWAFDEATGLLCVAHNASNVTVLGGASWWPAVPTPSF